VSVRTFTTHLRCQYLGGAVCDITVQHCTTSSTIQ